MELKKFLDRTNSNVFSDHLSISEADETELLDFLPVAFTADNLDYLKKKIDSLVNKVNRPLLLENITYIINWPNNEYTEIEFWIELLKSENLFMLLDVTNLYINSYNHNYDPYEFIDKLPKNKIPYLHVSGCKKSSNTNILIDSHSEPINEEVWALMRYIKPKIPVKGVILERDLNVRNYKDVSDDINKLKKWFYD